MASPAWIGIPGRVWRTCLVIAVAGSVAGCVGMQSSGPAAEFTPSTQSTQPDSNFSVPYASGPQPNESPGQIVVGFLVASGSDPAYSAVAGEYLVGSAARTWDPSSVQVFSTLNPAPAVPMAAGPHHTPRASVSVTGSVQAAFDGSDRYISAVAPDQGSVPYKFILVKVDGQWRISNPPKFRMLYENDFPYYYKAQDLYFVDQSDQALVPDPVFVPLGATESQLVTDLVNALAVEPATPWLACDTPSACAADTEFPAGTEVLPVTVDGTTATVDLGGAAAGASIQTRELISAQLVWTLTGSPASPSPIQSVVLEIDGKQFTPPATSPALCPGERVQGFFQTQATYQCLNPYLSAPTSFYYVNQGQPWSRCGSESVADLQGSIGSVLPVVGRTGVFNNPQCATGRYVSETSSSPPPVQPPVLRAVSLAAVSPDGKYLAIVPPGKDALYIGRLSGTAASFPGTSRLTEPGITALSWDRNDDLWVAQSGNISMLRATGTSPEPVTLDGGGNVSDLSVAPDGVRIALIVSGAGNGPGPQLEVAAINQSGPQAPGPRGGPSVHLSITDGVPLGVSLTDPIAVTWYGADDLIVINHAGSGNALWEVPVDGQQVQGPQATPAGTISITADGTANVLVAGLTDNQLAVSTGLEGPWQTLGEPGQDPAYPG
jgi:Lipoprotein LpqB beta-propeller domain/Sporulation and spore germination